MLIYRTAFFHSENDGEKKKIKHQPKTITICLCLLQLLQIGNKNPPEQKKKKTQENRLHRLDCRMLKINAHNLHVFRFSMFTCIFIDCNECEYENVWHSKNYSTIYYYSILQVFLQIFRSLTISKQSLSIDLILSEKKN